MYKFFYDSSMGEVAPILIDGVPPIDQSAQVAALTAQVAALTGQLQAMQQAIDTAQLALQPY